MSGLILGLSAPAGSEEPSLWLSLLVGGVGLVLLVDAIRRLRR